MFLGDASVPPGLRVYAVGDVHGRADCLEDMLELIADDRRERPEQCSKIVMLGDYTDRGPDSAKVLNLLVSLSNDPDFVCLKGNHDQWLEEFLLDPDNGDAFLRWGGMETLSSYGVEITSPRQSNTVLSRQLLKRMPRRHRHFLARLQPSCRFGDYFFAHAGVRPGVALEDQDPHDLMWIREEFLRHEGDFGAVVVHGHTPGPDVEIRRNRINVDSRAYESGKLSCVVLEAANHSFLQTGC